MPQPAYFVRCTRWRDDDDHFVQVAVCILDRDWEPVAEVTLAIGPFDDPDEIEARAELKARGDAWRTTSQLTLL